MNGVKCFLEAKSGLGGWVLFAVSVDCSVPAMNGCFWKLKGEEGEEMRLDGWMMVCIVYKVGRW